MEIRAISICTVAHLLLPLPLIQSVRMRVRRIPGIFEFQLLKLPHPLTLKADLATHQNFSHYLLPNLTSKARPRHLPRSQKP